jgi:MFS family permease
MDKKQWLFNPRILSLFLAIALAESARAMTMVQVPVFLRELGASIEQVGMFLTLSMIFPLVLRVIGGWLSDTIGRLRALTIGSVAGILTYLSYTFAPTWQMALIAPAFLAISTALIFPSYKAYIGDHTSEGSRGKVFGLSETVIQVAWILSPPLGGLIGQQLGYRVMFSASMFTFSVSTLLFLALSLSSPAYEQPSTDQVSLTSLRSTLGQMLFLVLSGGLVTWILIVDGVRDVASKLSFELMPLFLSDIAGMTKGQIGLLDGMYGVAITLTTLPAGWLVDKTSERLGITLGLATMIVSRLVFALSYSFWGFGTSWILLGIGGGLIDPAGAALIAKGVPARVRGITYALVATSLGIISLPAPWIGTKIWELMGPRTPFLLTVVLGSFALIPAWTKLVVKKQALEPDLRTPS